MVADPHDAPPHAGQVVRRMLLRQNIAIDAETAQLVGRRRPGRSRPVRRPGRRARADPFPPPIASCCSDNGSGLGRRGKAPPVSLLHIDRYALASEQLLDRGTG